MVPKIVLCRTNRHIGRVIVRQIMVGILTAEKGYWARQISDLETRRISWQTFNKGIYFSFEECLDSLNNTA
jgi:hypothetical protein